MITSILRDLAVVVLVICCQISAADPCVWSMHGVSPDNQLELMELLETEKLIYEEMEFLSSFDDKEEWAHRWLREFAEAGESKFMKGEEFRAKDSMKATKVSGISNDGTFIATDVVYGPLFIKKQPLSLLTDLLGKVIKNKIVGLLGIGPEMEYVNIGDEHFFVMTAIEGINIKDLLKSTLESQKPGGRELVEAAHSKMQLMLGDSTCAFEDCAKQSIAKLLDGDEYTETFSKITQLLDSAGFVSEKRVVDFQFMFDLRHGPLSIQVIDADLLRRQGEPYFGEVAPVSEAINITLRGLKNYYD